MTEDEAKTKWCPFIRMGGPVHTEAEGTAANRWPGQEATDYGQYCCIASACMAWRWSVPAVPAQTETQETGTRVPRVKILPPDETGVWAAIERGRDPPDREGPAWRWVTWARTIPAVPGTGCCGLAGSPSPGLGRFRPFQARAAAA